MSEIAPPEARRSVAGFQEGVRGVIPPVNPERRGSFLSDVITELGFAGGDSVEEAVQAARQPGLTVGGLLVDGGLIDEEQLAQATAERSGLDYVDLDEFEVDDGAAGLIGRSAAQRYGAVPIAFAGDGALIVALEDPADALAISDIEVMTRNDVRRVVASPRAIAELIGRIPEAGRMPSSPAAPVEVEPEAAEEAPEQPPIEPPADVALNGVPESEEPDTAPGPPAGADPEEPLREKLAEADAVQERMWAQLAEAEAEQEGLREQVVEAETEPERLRAQLADAEAEQERLREQVVEAEAERDRARDDAANANSGRDLIRNEAMRLAKELKRLESAEG